MKQLDCLPGESLLRVSLVMTRENLSLTKGSQRLETENEIGENSIRENNIREGKIREEKIRENKIRELRTRTEQYRGYSPKSANN